MKYLILILLFSSTLLSQSLPGGARDRYEGGNKEQDSKKTTDRAYFTIGVGILTLNEFTGAEGNFAFGVIKKSNLILGGGINAVLFDSFKEEAETNRFLKYTNGFFNIGYYLKLSNYIKVSPTLIFGIGRMNISNNVLGIAADNNGDWYTFLEPNIDLDLRIWNKNHLNLAISYRNSFGVDYFEITNKKFSSVCFKVNYKLIIE